MSVPESDIIIRRAIVSDRDVLVGLLLRLMEEEGEETRPDRSAVERTIETFLGERREGARFFLVAEVAGEVVGCASVQRLYSTWQGWPYYLVDDVVVAPQHRRSGAGTVLLEEVERQAIELGACRLDLHVRSINLGAITLVSRAGYRKVGDVHLTKNLVRKQ